MHFLLLGETYLCRIVCRMLRFIRICLLGLWSSRLLTCHFSTISGSYFRMLFLFHFLSFLAILYLTYVRLIFHFVMFKWCYVSLCSKGGYTFLLNVHLKKIIALGNEYKFFNHKKRRCFQRKAANEQGRTSDLTLINV